MRVIVHDGGGEVLFSYTTEGSKPREGVSPAENDKRAVAAALEEAREFLVPGLGRTLPSERDAGNDQGSDEGSRE